MDVARTCKRSMTALRCAKLMWTGIQGECIMFGCGIMDEYLVDKM